MTRQQRKRFQRQQRLIERNYRHLPVYSRRPVTVPDRHEFHYVKELATVAGLMAAAIMLLFL